MADDNNYVHGYDTSEMSRLHGQHDALKSAMGALVYAPINLSLPNLRILDCGTADGNSTLSLPPYTQNPKHPLIATQLTAVFSYRILALLPRLHIKIG
jgi:hypothetical protein